MEQMILFKYISNLNWQIMLRNPYHVENITFNKTRIKRFTKWRDYDREGVF